MNERQSVLRQLVIVAATFALLGLLAAPAEALITGGVGNDAVRDPGWPTGAAAVFNVPQRVAWWEGPPFGGGEYHGECRGNTDDFNRVLVNFAAIEGERKQLVIRDGVGRSFWLNPDREADKVDAAQVDWVFVIWVKDRFEMQRGLPAGMRATGEQTEPIPQIEVYTGGNIDWREVQLPDGLEVIDYRLESHGFTLADGTVIEGTVTDLTNGKPISAEVQLQRVEPNPDRRGYSYPTQQTLKTDDAGRWVIRSAPEGSHRVVISAPGYASRAAGHYAIDSEPRYIPDQTGLVPGGSVSGRTLGPDGKPLEGVEIQVRDIATPGGGRYDLVGETKVSTSANGTFLIRDIPLGSASLWMGKTGYVRPGLGPKIEVPASGLEYELKQAAEIVIKVDFDDVERPQQYMVSMEPEGGSMVGSWGGSGNIGEDNSMHWKQIPPGKYVVFGRPNPGGARDQTESVTINLKGGETREVVLKARKKE